MRKIICFLLLSLFVLAPALGMAADNVISQNDRGDKVALVQQRLRDLGYLNYRPTGKFSELTVAAVQSFQQQNGIAPDGQIGSDTYNLLFSDTAKKAPANSRIKKVAGPAYNGSVKTHGTLGSWDAVKSSIPEGSDIAITDYNTGATYTMQRVGGVNCAQVAAKTSADYAAYLQSFGGDATWEHRGVLVTIGSQTYAASLFGMPTGGEDINNSGMKGHTFLYFNNGKTDIFSLSDDEHVIALNSAAGV
ncbi:hypothetical protein CE91St36_14810 [Christensenellaceae bacterium]|nr:hypothetical protein CE91St36_14810 [Christensenellaceae bacterium]BDF61332.1 hypothetical protein CE91St37_14820 [Christensenellaceae bacterium]